MLLLLLPLLLLIANIVHELLILSTTICMNHGPISELIIRLHLKEDVVSDMWYHISFAMLDQYLTSVSLYQDILMWSKGGQAIKLYKLGIKLCAKFCGSKRVNCTCT